MELLKAMQVPGEVLLLLGAAAAVVKAFIAALLKYDEVIGSERARKRIEKINVGLNFGLAVFVFVASVAFVTYKFNADQSTIWFWMAVGGLLFLVALLAAHKKFLKFAQDHQGSQDPAVAGGTAAVADPAVAGGTPTAGANASSTHGV